MKTTVPEYPALEAKPYWIGVSPSHVAAPIGPMLESETQLRIGHLHTRAK